MSHHWGYVAATSSAILFGLSAALNKIVLFDVHPLVVAGMIYFIAGIVLSPICFTPRVSGRMPNKMDKKDFQILLLVVLSGVIIGPFLFLYGLSKTTAVSTSLLLSTEVLFTALLAFIFLKERADKKSSFAMFLIVLGAVIVTTNLQFQNLGLCYGNLFVILGCLFWAVDNNLSKLLSIRNNIALVVCLKSLIGGSIVLVLVFTLGIPFNINLALLPYLVIVGVFSIGVSIMLFMLGLRLIGAMRTSVVFSSSSLFGALFAFLIIKETISIPQGIAGVIMITGVYLLCRAARPARKTKEMRNEK